MTREKQIEEMARIIHGTPFSDMHRAVALYNAGYRKQSKVAKEIFDTIKEKLIFNTYGIATISNKTFYKLKKKYTG